MWIEKVSDSDSECLISYAGNYADKTNQNGIQHGRANRRTDALTEEERAILRSGLGKLMWISRIARPGAIYDASAAAQTFYEGNWRFASGQEEFSKLADGENEQKEIRCDFQHMPCCQDFF